MLLSIYYNIIKMQHLLLGVYAVISKTTHPVSIILTLIGSFNPWVTAYIELKRKIAFIKPRVPGSYNIYGTLYNYRFVKLCIIIPVFFQMMIKRSLSESGCPPHIIDDLMENCHERRWPPGLSSLETRQNNRR